MHEIPFLFLNSVKDGRKSSNGEYNAGYQGREYERESRYDREPRSRNDYDKGYRSSHDPYPRDRYGGGGAGYAEPYPRYPSDKPPMYDDAVSSRYSSAGGMPRRYNY